MPTSTKEYARTVKMWERRVRDEKRIMRWVRWGWGMFVFLITASIACSVIFNGAFSVIAILAFLAGIALVFGHLDAQEKLQDALDGHEDAVERWAESLT